jgi:hypothetical protein
MKNYFTGLFIALTVCLLACSITSGLLYGAYYLGGYDGVGALFIAIVVLGAGSAFYPDIGKAFYKWKESQ